MHHRPLRRAIALSMGALLALAGTASADRLLADGDVLTTTIQGTKHLGTVAPGTEVSVDVRFVLTCTGVSHVDPGQSVVLVSGGGSKPADGQIVSVTTVTLDPVPASWATDGVGCPDPVPSVEGGPFSRVTLRAPTTPGNGYPFTVVWTRSLEPAGGSDSGALGQAMTSVSFTMNVVGNIAPSLAVPADFTVEGDTTGGWTGAWSGVGATDPEDAPDPVPTCAPAAGSLLPLGVTTVSCSVADSGGLTASDAFDVTVVDTTAPTLTGIPVGQSLTTGDPTGTTITYTAPGATDFVDADPGVACLPASGSHVGLGTTTVTCTATDDTGNHAQASFDVTVAYVAPHVASASWGEPVAGSGSVFSANRGRTVPVKVELSVDGSVRTTGDARLTVTPCAGGSPVTLPLVWGGGRWNVSLETADLAGTCHTVAASIDGLEAGAFQLELRGTAPAKANNAAPDTTSGATPTKTKDAKPAKASDKPAKTGNGKD